jgi:uncharacterized protein YciI
MVVLISEYQRPLDEVDVHREAHLAFLAGLREQGKIVVSGRRKPPAGGVVVLDVGSVQEAEAIMAEDPFATSGVAVYQAYEFTPTAPPS